MYYYMYISIWLWAGLTLYRHSYLQYCYCLYVYTYMLIWHKEHFLETLLSTAQHCFRSFSTLMKCVQNWLWCNCNVKMSGIFAYIHLHMTNGSLLSGMFTGSVAADRFRSWSFHDDVIKWKHFPRYWPFVQGIHRSPVNSPHKGQWHGALMFSLICAWINGWINNREAGDLRHYRAHYDVIVMLNFIEFQWCYISAPGLGRVLLGYSSCPI